LHDKIKMVDKWSGKVAVVTGTSSGVGAAIMKDFAKSGLTVIGLARRVDRVEKIIEEELKDVAGSAHAYKCDVSNPDSVREAFRWIEEKFSVVHILVNNAAVGANVSLLDDSEKSRERTNEILDTNVRGLVDCTREAYRLMKKSNEHGLIVNINSVVGHKLPFFGMSMNMYAPSKYAVTALTEVIRQELIIEKNDRVRITVTLTSNYVI
jgi:NADP+-dependent farnesol dehydrogenase